MASLTLAALLSLGLLKKIVTVAIGLGLVIFFHELGHFAVAKWCGVLVERFSIGFGPILWRRTWGETEYALSAIPFGGYVKMLGQDDVDPGQMTDEQIVADPRSYPSKSVLQRMAIISAGVTMNVLTGLMFFGAAFFVGVDSLEREVGTVRVGLPAWEHGVRPGDTLVSMNGAPLDDFGDVLRQTALSRGDIRIVGAHDDGTTYDVTVTPDRSGNRRLLGVGPQNSLNVVEVRDPETEFVAMPGSPAAAAAFQSQDRLVELDGQSLTSYQQLENLLDGRRNETVEFMVERRPQGASADVAPQRVAVPVAPMPFRSLGLRMSMGKIVAIRRESPADQQRIQKNDVITHVDGLDVGKDLDPLMLPDYIAERAGKSVVLTIKQEVRGGEPQTRDITITPEARGAWSEPPIDPESPLSIPSLGLAYELLPRVLQVDPEGPAAQLDIRAGDLITSIEIPRPRELAQQSSEPTKLKIGEVGWAFAFWTLQQQSYAEAVTLTLKRDAGGETKVSVPLVAVDGWRQPGPRGLLLDGLTRLKKADSFAGAMAMSLHHTRDSMIEIYLTLRNLFSGDLSIKMLHGPIGIAKNAAVFAEEGLAAFSLFLGLISVNLAVINFLPIPMLDGGHMVFLIWEGLFRRKPSERVVVAATYVGLVFVLGLMVTVLWIDLFVVKK